MVALTSARSAGLVGVFLSVTTVPAAAYACVALIEGRWTEAGLSIVQLVVNVVSVAAAAAAVLVLTKRSRHDREDRGRRLSTG